jgi:hypothetical protein
MSSFDRDYLQYRCLETLSAAVLLSSNMKLAERILKPRSPMEEITLLDE